MNIPLKISVVFVSLFFVLAFMGFVFADFVDVERDEQCVNQCNLQYQFELEQCGALTASPYCVENAGQHLELCINSCPFEEPEEPEQQILCCFGDGANDNCLHTTISQCRGNEGAVMDCGLPEGDVAPALSVHDCNEQRKQAFEDCKPFKGISRATCMGQAVLQSQECKKAVRDVVLEELRNFTITSQNLTDPALINLTRDVISTGVNNSVYVNGTYDCRSFAHSLERNLTALGYNATWTSYWCYGGAGNPPATAHAVTDVHLADGRTVWIEPQNNRIISLDFDGDGIVEVNNNGYVPGQNMGQTDDNCKISVFEDRAAAAAAGVPGA